MSKQGKITIIEPSINKTSLNDERGAMLSFVTNVPIKEFVYQVTRAGFNRGYHRHPEFDEYSLFTSGEGVYIETLADGSERFITVGPGVVLHIPKGVYHSFNAITEMKSVTMLTKAWDDCNNPIINE
jgi:cupin superfamily acireductone dioxygenase involved in methionine salvage